MAYEADHQTVELTNDRCVHIMRSTIDGADPQWVMSIEHGGLRITVPLTDDNVVALVAAITAVSKATRHLSSV